MDIAMNQNSKKIINTLLDKYESSKTFNASNKVNQRFKVEIASLFTKYTNDADYDTFVQVNEAIMDLSKQHYIQILKKQNDVIQQVALNLDYLVEVYRILHRESRKDEQIRILSVLEKYQYLDMPVGVYARAQMERLSLNKKIEYYSGSVEELEDILEATEAICMNEKEVFVRDLSIKLYGDSKKLEQLKSKIQGLLFQYGWFEEKESVFEECGVVQTPTYVMVKGNGILHFHKQSMNLSQLGSDIGLSTTTIQQLLEIEVIGQRIVTIENLTSFHNYSIEDDFVVYLGGFHNKVKTQFLKLVYRENPNKIFLHFGDIDIGGFQIFRNLCRKTEIKFQMLYMNIATLVQHQSAWKSLTKNDNERLIKLLDSLRQTDCESLNESRAEIEEREKIAQVLAYMKTNQCKLEQEAVSEVKTIKVVAAVIRNKEKIFATQRGYGEFQGGWEFPGGKVEVGETSVEALKREIQEELQVEITVEEFIETVEYDYPTFHLSMDCYYARIIAGEIVLTEHQDAKWLGEAELDSVAWLPADVDLIRKIQVETIEQ